MRKFIHVALMVESAHAFGRAICGEVVRFVHERGEWLLFPVEPGLGVAATREWLRANRIDGIISGGPSRELFLSLQESGLPLVTLAYRDVAPGVTSVIADSEATARMAAAFFRQAGFWNFAFCGYPGVGYSDVREAAFRTLLQEQNNPVHVLPADPHFCPEYSGYNPVSDTEADRLLGEWLRGLPKPVAIFACNDARGQQLLRVAQECGIDVPGEAAVLGVDNDELLCTMCYPSLSSIEPNGAAIGRAAALALDALLRQTARPGVQVKIPPLRVAERHSTGIPPIENPMVIKALGIIRDSVRSNLSTKSLCDALGCSRTTLDNLFKEHLGYTSAKEINRTRLKHVTELLQGTELPLKEIAMVCGFSSPASFAHFIRREANETPLNLRRKSTPPPGRF